MSQLFHRLNRLIKSEINYSQTKMNVPKYQEFTTDFSLLEGNDLNVTTVPLSITNALTGVKLYEAIIFIVEGENSVSIDSSYNFGVTTLNSLIAQGITLAEILDLAIEDMEQELASTREATVSAMSIEKINIKKYNEADAEFKKWQYRTDLAIEKGNDYLAAEALKRQKFFFVKVNNLKVAIKEQMILSNCLKLSLFALSNKVAEAKTFRDNIANFEEQEVSEIKIMESDDFADDLKILKRQLDQL
ncbi:PspA/IM30 family protein [Anabaena sphaerica FACHB-251]|uniref:PspA/IM30 family protein n=1 Tax=Anabaena sphaerica FACHB-251 TaxID=2692883 RepID=A0A926WH92_9NOST|nr:PspA/IM30 family protein [Anabaena sphaerica]MBD2294534.1 PspA/IM30 family protein [Anabaena sphaerica FACHB-251]